MLSSFYPSNKYMYLCTACVLFPGDFLCYCMWLIREFYFCSVSCLRHQMENFQQSRIKSLDQFELLFLPVFFNNCTLVRMDYTTSLLEYTVNTSDYTTQPLEQSSHTGHRCALVTELTSKLCGSSVLPNALLCCLLTITGSRWERKSSSHREYSLHPQHLVLYISTKITWPI